MVDPPEEVDKALNKLVISSGKLGQTWRDIVFPEDRFIGLAGYIDFLAEATENLTEAERAQQLAVMATANELPALTTLVEQQIEARQRGFNIITARQKAMAGLYDEEVQAMMRWREETGRSTIEVVSATEMLQKQWETFQSTTAYQTAELERQMERISLAVGRGARRLVLAVGDSLAGLLDTVASVGYSYRCTWRSRRRDGIGYR